MAFLDPKIIKMTINCQIWQLHCELHCFKVVLLQCQKFKKSDVYLGIDVNI